MAEARSMEERIGYFRRARAFFSGKAKAAKEKWLRHKLDKAIRLMKTPELSLVDRIERDRVVKWLGRKGDWQGNCLLKLWVNKGEVWTMPDPEILGKAIARGGEDSEHLHWVAHASVEMGAGFGVNYYFARLLAAECRMLARMGHDFDPKKSITYFICSGAEKLVRFMEEKNREQVEQFERARKG